MKRLVVVGFAIALLVTLPALADEVTGYISDAKCGVAHSDGSERSIKCVQACVKNGVAAVFVTEADKKVLKIADASKVMDHLGHKVTVTGKVEGDSIEIESIKMAP